MQLVTERRWPFNNVAECPGPASAMAGEGAASSCLCVLVGLLGLQQHRHRQTCSSIGIHRQTVLAAAHTHYICCAAVLPSMRGSTPCGCLAVWSRNQHMLCTCTRVQAAFVQRVPLCTDKAHELVSSLWLQPSRRLSGRCIVLFCTAALSLYCCCDWAGLVHCSQQILTHLSWYLPFRFRKSIST